MPVLLMTNVHKANRPWNGFSYQNVHMYSSEMEDYG